MITKEQKRRCVELIGQGKTQREVYEEYIAPNSTMSLRSFRRRFLEWKEKLELDDKILENANLAYRFSPNASTVQLNGKGEVVQAWIKQRTEDRIEEILEAIKDNSQVCKVEPSVADSAEGMLEIPLFDMHFGIADLEFYTPSLKKIIAIIQKQHWDKIVIPVGQDLFHNDSIDKGVTSKGTLIERVDMKKAFLDAKTFYFNLIDEAIGNANEVSVMYSAGNHDKTVGWMFVQVLKERYGDMVDDSIKERKALLWKGCFLGLTHGSKKVDTAVGLRGCFTVEYPTLFAEAKVREIHAGHLHHEGWKDEYGVQIRRLSTGNKDDEWTIDEGFRSQKRFALFEYMPNELKSIHYV